MRIEIEKALVFISQQFQKKLKTEDLAREAGLSAFHFHRLFIEETKLTPQKYLEKLRLEHAAHVMVLDPSLKMIQLAFESGFPSPSSFSRAFSQYFGMSPSKYKNNKSTARSGNYRQLEGKMALTQGLEISYLAKQYFRTQLIHPLPEEIEEKVVEQDLTKNSWMYGIYLDAPIHHELSACRYLIGQICEYESESNAEMKAGYYLHFSVKGKMEKIRKKILDIYSYLLQLNYVISYPIAFEKFHLRNPEQAFKYLEIERELFIPISRK